MWLIEWDPQLLSRVLRSGSFQMVSKCNHVADRN